VLRAHHPTSPSNSSAAWSAAHRREVTRIVGPWTPRRRRSWSAIELDQRQSLAEAGGRHAVDRTASQLRADSSETQQRATTRSLGGRRKLRRTTWRRRCWCDCCVARRRSSSSRRVYCSIDDERRQQQYERLPRHDVPAAERHSRRQQGPAAADATICMAGRRVGRRTKWNMTNRIMRVWRLVDQRARLRDIIVVQVCRRSSSCSSYHDITAQHTSCYRTTAAV